MPLIDPYENKTSNLVDPFESQIGVPNASPSINQPGFFSKVGTDLSNRASNIWNEVKNTNPLNIIPSNTFIPQMPIPAGQTLLRTAGQVAGGVNDVVGESMKYLYNLLPEDAKQWVNSQAEATKKGFAPMTKDIGTAIQPALDLYGKVKEAYPEQVGGMEKNVGALANIATVLPVVQGASKIYKIGKEAIVPIAEDIASEYLKYSPQQELSAVIAKGRDKGIKPTGKGSTVKASADYDQKFETGVKKIVENKNNIEIAGQKGVVPETLSETADALNQTKQQALEGFLGDQATATNAGVTVNLQPMVDDLVKTSNLPKGQGVYAAQYAKSQLPLYADEVVDINTGKTNWVAKEFTPQEIQSEVAQLGADRHGYYMNPNFQGLSNIGVDTMMRSRMANALNDAVESFMGPGHQELKDTWAALKTIEKSVVNRTDVASRQATSGFFDLTEPFTYYHLAKGLLTGNPAELASAIIQKGTKEYLKAQNNPNKYIKEMFQKADQIINGQSILRNTQIFAKSTPYTPPEGIDFNPNVLSMDIPYRANVTTPPTVEMPGGLNYRQIPITEKDWESLLNNRLGANIPQPQITQITDYPVKEVPVRPQVIPTAEGRFVPGIGNSPQIDIGIPSVQETINKPQVTNTYPKTEKGFVSEEAKLNSIKEKNLSYQLRIEKKRLEKYQELVGNKSAIVANRIKERIADIDNQLQYLSQ
jgi:hypothetical protein